MSDAQQTGSIPPVYTKLKDLHLTTELVKLGKANVTIVVPASGIYHAHASRIEQAIEERCGVCVPIATDDGPAGSVPIGDNLILFGNRSTHRTIEELYNRYYTLLDLRYPGPEGFEVRTLHNPFGNGLNVIYAGASDAAGVDAATQVLVQKLQKAEAGNGTLAIGWLMEIQLGKGIQVPDDVSSFTMWEASASYGSKGNFGWTSLSKRMAMYYMTGDPLHAREFLRLAFPDEQAKEEIAQIDDERIENKDEPLSGPYHYGAYMLVLYWDLIEESPVFTDADRLRVTQALSKQFSHPQEWGWRRRIAENLDQATNRTQNGRLVAFLHRTGRGQGRVHEWSAADRHGAWSFVALYCLARYFQKDYASLLWPECIDAVDAYFEFLHRPDELNTAYESLTIYPTGVAPAMVYLLLAGERDPVVNGALGALLWGHEVLISGREPDWALKSAAIGYLHQATYLTQDGRWMEYLRRTGMDLNVFRLGQSFWPEAHLQPKLPVDLLDSWTIQPMPEPMWRQRCNGLPLTESFLMGSFRTAPNASGDFIMIKGWNGAARNAFHTFGLLELRLAGQTVLDGFLNQVLTKADGMVEPEVGMDAALRYRDVVGQTAAVVGETPKAPFCNWRRTLVQRVGRYALIVDKLAFHTGSKNMEVDVLWQRKGASLKVPEMGAVRIEETETPFEIRLSDPFVTIADDSCARMTWIGSIQEGQQKHLFSLIAEAKGALACVRLADNAVALALPEPAVAVAGEHRGLRGELVVLAQDHLYGMAMTKAAPGLRLFEADASMHVDWDFAGRTLQMVADRKTQVHLSVGDTCDLTLDGQALKAERGPEGLVSLQVSSGRHTICGAVPEPDALARGLNDLLSKGRQRPCRAAATGGPSLRPGGPSLPAAFTVDVGAKAVDLTAFYSGDRVRICAAEGQTVHVLTDQGAEQLRLRTDGPIRMLRWWEEHGLLLAGCADEKVIAFDLYGARRWTFVSEMDPDVFRAAKTYWFKSAPGHEGIHGLHTGVFLNGKSQAFVGSACTLEILDESGKLVKRTAVFWGPGSKFALMDGPEGSIDLLVARRPADTHAATVLNNRALDQREHRFHGAIRGYTTIEPWGCLVRRHIFCIDLDGDGQKEVVSDLNGTWNAVTVWAKDGAPLYSVSFGPSKTEVPILTYSQEHMRDLDIADLDGDGKKEILAATCDGMVIALDHRCRKLWAIRLPSPPTVIACVEGEHTIRVVTGCEDGTVVFLDSTGAVVGTDTMTGVPTCVQRLNEGVVLATDGGQIKSWKV